MQAYEHIMAAMIKLSEPTGDKKGLKLEENLNVMRNYAAYFTLPDSIRPLVAATKGKAFRAPSHFTDGAWMEFITGSELKNSTDGYPRNKLYVPDGLELRAADGKTDLQAVLKYNPHLRDSENPEGNAIWWHLVQDTYTDELFQEYMANCHVDAENDLSEEKVSLYGNATKGGVAMFKQTGKNVSMKTFREAVAATQKLSTLELFRKLREAYPDITFDQIESAVHESYDKTYPEVMMNAKNYAVPSKDEQQRILDALRGDDSYYLEQKEELVKMGAFVRINDIDEKVSELVDKVTFVENNPQRVKELEELVK